jgi:uncharacterized protein YlaI
MGECVTLNPVLHCVICKKKFIVYYEGIKRELKRRPIYEYRCDERLKTKTEGSILLGYTGFLGRM